MKIDFDNGYIEIRKSIEPEKVFLIISSKDDEQANKRIVNSCELTIEQLKQLISDFI